MHRRLTRQREGRWVAISGRMQLSRKRPNTHEMNATQRETILQRWNVVQHELMPQLRAELDGLTPRLERVIHTLEWVRVEEFTDSSSDEIGRPPHERAWLANAFVAKAVLGLTTTVALIERLTVDRALRRICGFAMCRKLPSEATFSRAFAEFAKSGLAERAHEALIEEHLGDRIIGHLSRDATAIESRERPQYTPKPEVSTGPAAQGSLIPAPDAAPSPARGSVGVARGNAPKRGIGNRGAAKRAAKARARKRQPVLRQRSQDLEQMIEELPTACDRGTKSNAQGYKDSWNGYKAHIDTADCGVPISVLVTSASMHDSRAAIPLSLISAQRVTNLYDVMDAAYCSAQIHEHCRELGHVPLIDHNPRGGAKEEFEPADAIRYNERTAAERTNARLKDEFGGRNVRVRGHDKVSSHLMFGILALSADQFTRLYRRE